jgi:hypothetical protein
MEISRVLNADIEAKAAAVGALLKERGERMHWKGYKKRSRVPAKRGMGPAPGPALPGAEPQPPLLFLDYGVVGVSR